jgi:hypothetical protein
MLAISLRGWRLALCVTMLVVFPSAWATPSLLEDENSSIVVDPAIQTAMSSWKVETVEHLKEISNWYRVGSTGPERWCGNNGPMSLVSASVFDTNPLIDSRPDSLTAFYTHPQFDLRLDYSVDGFAPGSGTSRMGETISITNTGTVPLNIHFFEYQDLDLTNTPNDDSVVQNTAASGVQSDPSGTTVTAYIINCDRYELASYPSTLAKLQNTGPDNLAYPPGFGFPFGPGDVTWSLQWDFVTGNPIRPAIPPGQTVVINKLWELQMTPVPEPTGLVTLATMFQLLRRRRP